MILHLLVIQIVMFIILLLVLRQIFYKQLNESLARLQALHKLNVERERELKSALEAADREREEKMSAARDEASRIIKEAAAAAARLKEDVKITADEKILSAMAHAHLDLERKEQSLLASRQQDVLQAAVKLVTAALSAKGMECLHTQLVNEAIEEFAGLDTAMFVPCVSDISVSSARALDEISRERVTRVIKEKAGEAVRLSFREVPEMLAGVCIDTGVLNIDGTLCNRLERVMEHLRKAT